MSTPAISDPLWAEMTTAQQAEAVLTGRATLRQIVAGLLDGPDQLHEACRRFLTHTDASLKNIRLESDANGREASDASQEAGDEQSETTLPDASAGASRKRRPGLPPGYTLRSTPQ